MRRLSIFLIAILPLYSWAQSWAHFEGDIDFRVNANGICAIDLSTLEPKSGYQLTAHHFLEQMGIWISARDESNALHTSIQMLKTPGQYDFSYGPLDTIVSQPDTSGWNKVWVMKASWVNEHRKNYNQLGYQIRSELEAWPGAHDGGDFVQYLAPFADVNANQQYDPENGDYPYIRGDESIYLICNDNSFEHKVSGGIPLGVEVHVQIYRYYDQPRTLYFEYYLINRLDFEYHDVQLGVFMAGACGNENDNYAATIRSHNTITLFNGDSQDEGAFEENLPYVFARLLNKELEGSVVFELNGTGYKAVPSDAPGFDNLLHSKWKNGDPIQFGSDGTNASYDYPFMYVHDSDPGSAFWSEESAENTPGHRAILGRTSYSELNSGSYIKFNFCMGFGFYDSLQSPIAVVNNSSTEARDKYYMNSTFRATDQISGRIFPNPAVDHINFSGLEKGIYQLKVTDIQGRMWMNEEIVDPGSKRCNISVPAGVYIVELNKNGRIFNSLLIVQP